MEIKNAKAGTEATLERQFGTVRCSGLGRKLDPALKSWMDNVIIPTLVREYLAEIEKRNRFATAGASEVTSDKDGDEPMILRCAAYARYSSDLQSPISIDDQLRICREYAKSRGFVSL